MALTKRQEYKQEIMPNGVIQVRRSDIIEEDGAVIATNYHRHILNPGDDVADEATEVQAVAAAVWTTEVVNAYQTEN